MTAGESGIGSGETAIRSVLAAPGGGRLVTLGLPGLEIARDGGTWFSPDDMAQTVAHLAGLKVRMVLLLTEPVECPPGTVHILRRLCAQSGIRAVALPIADFSGPSAAWERAWRRIAQGVRRHLDAGDAIGLCCLYGAGRSGTVAAMILQERGLGTADAIETVRQGFADSIESPVQEAWLHARGRPISGTDMPGEQQ